MQVFILGGTGSIGTAIVNELRARAHVVTALSRSGASDNKLTALNARVVRGNLLDPEKWVHAAVSHDAIIHVAATFDEDMGDVDKRVISAIIQAASEADETLRLLYTGGCWLYGDTGDEIATEDRSFEPLPAFSWMVDHGERLLNAPSLSTAIIHPAMVYHKDGGVFERFLSAAQEGRPLEIWGSPDTRWPIIERSDLAHAYCNLLTRPDLDGHFNAVSQEGVRVGDIAKLFAECFGGSLDTIVRDVDELIKEHGSWAKGPTLDQQMSSQKLREATGWKPVITDYRASAVFSR